MVKLWAGTAALQSLAQWAENGPMGRQRRSRTSPCELVRLITTQNVAKTRRKEYYAFYDLEPYTRESRELWHCVHMMLLMKSVHGSEALG